MVSSRRRCCRFWISSVAIWPPGPRQGRRSNMNRVVAPLIILVVLLVLIAGGTFYQVDETEQVVVTQFGEPARAPITTPGLKVKVPFIQTVRRFDKRVLEWDGRPEQFPTLEKQFITLDTTARWRIADPLRFLQSVGDERAAQSRLDDLVNSAARDVISSHLLIQAVRTFARELPTEVLGEEGAPEERLGRDRLTELMVQRARQNLPHLGIELIDVRIKSINYGREVEQQVYQRMISERRRIAARFRSEGDGSSAKIRGEKERELDRIRSEAYRKAQEIIGKVDAEAARIYAEAYGQDSEFYAFYQTLDAYKQTLQKNASVLLTTGSDFYRYLKYVNGVVPPATAKEGR